MSSPAVQARPALTRDEGAVDALAPFDDGRTPAQLVVLCREAGDRASLQAALPGLQQPAPVVEPQPEVTAALPVGPIQPEW